MPLNALGQAQAQRLGERLAGETGHALLCSDLLRAQQTAQPLARVWSKQPVLQVGFREQCFGVLEGMDVPTIRQQHPDLWAAWLEHRADFALPRGESLRQFHARVLGAVREAADAHPHQAVAVVTHGGVLDMLWRTANGLPLDGLRQCDIPNTGINRLRWRSRTLQILQWADTAHLDRIADPAAGAAGAS